MEREAEQAAFVTRRGSTTRDGIDVQEGRRQELIGGQIDDADSSTLLTDEETIGVTGSVCDRNGIVHAIDHSGGVDGLGVDHACGTRGKKRSEKNILEVHVWYPPNK